MTIAARLDAVCVDYPTATGTVTALKDVTISFESGTTTAILGRSGSGKSTLASVLTLLRTPSRGDLAVAGLNVSELRVLQRDRLRAREVGMVFQAYHLEPSLTALENIMLPWTFHRNGLGRGAAKERAGSILERLGIADLASRKPNAMSGGQRQRVAIGRALFQRPTVLVADEPTGNLDEESAAVVAELIYSFAEEYGSAVVVVTHDETIARLAHRRLRLIRGELQEITAKP